MDNLLFAILCSYLCIVMDNTGFLKFNVCMTFRKLFLYLFILLAPARFNFLSGQAFQSIKQAEDTLAAILASLNRIQDDSTKNLINHVFFATLREALKLQQADQYQFDSLKTLVKLESPDHKFRIFHWNLPSASGKHRYYGFLKMLNHDPPLIYTLIDRSDSIPAPDTVLLDNTNWFGALYYKVIPMETGSGTTAYTILGWAGKNAMMTQKVIEVLSFDNMDRPHFGMKVFPGYLGGNRTRVIFRYASATTMLLKYEMQIIQVKKGWNKKKRVFDTEMKEMPMIIFDRLIPMDPQLEGQFQFYIPAGDLSDGFAYDHNCWRFNGAIDSRNKKK
jgi:hypothetical protein